MSRECPDCMPKHRADLAQSEAWRDEHGVRSEGWLHPSRNADRLGQWHCNCCGRYYTAEQLNTLALASLATFQSALQRAFGDH